MVKQPAKAPTSKAKRAQKAPVPLTAAKIKAIKANKEAKGKSKAAAVDVVEPQVAEAKDVATKAVKTAKAAPSKASEAKKNVAEDVNGAVREATKSSARKRKTAEDYMSAAEDAVKAVAGKVGTALKHVVEDFGEASGLAANLAVEAKEGKEGPATKKAKGKAGQAVKAAAEPVAAKGKAADKKAGKTGKAAQSGEDVAMQSGGEEEKEDDDDEFIGGFESSDGEGADSSDDESDAEEVAIREAGKKVEVSKLPMVAKDDKSVAARLKKAQKKKDTKVGTLYLGRIPHGFYEDQMKEYFSQFGDVTRLRLARNKKTGASKHYAYIEMSSASVAEIVAETMNNYLLMGHLLKCQVVPQDQVHPELWVGANKKFRKVPRARVEKLRNERTRSKEERAKSNSRLLAKQEKRKANLKAKGIDYDFEGHA